jgi:predicted amidohydrolase
VTAPYTAVALQTSVHNVPNRDQVEVNLKHIGNMIDLVIHICSLELPVRLIALGEGAVQGFIDEIIDMEQAEYCDVMAADIPGPETEALGAKAKEHGCYILAQLKTRNPDYPGRFFNTVFLLDPQGQVIYQHQKNIILYTEHSTTPHDVYDDWVAKHGDSLETFFPVAKTEIGNIAGSVGVEGAFPEAWRAFAMNGAEILYHASLPEPWVSREMFQLMNRARALDNTAYMLAPNTGSLIVSGPPGTPPTTIGGALGGQNRVCTAIAAKCWRKARWWTIATSPRRSTSRRCATTASTRASRTGCRISRPRSSASSTPSPIWPKNLPPLQHADKGKVVADTVEKLIARGAFTRSKIRPD